MIEFPHGTKAADIQDRYTREALVDATNEQIDYLLDIIADLPDEYVTFEPEDPAADDPYAVDESEESMPWSLGHLILHVTASSEEGAARGASLARGVAVKWRDRYEPDWRGFTMVRQLVHRIEESRSMRLAYLEAWPDEPHLDNIYAPNQRSIDIFGEINAIGMTLQGMKHEQEHFDQLDEIIRQAREAAGSLR